MAEVLTAAGALRSSESRELGRLLILKVAIRLDRSLGAAGVAALSYHVANGGPSLRAAVPPSLARMLPDAPPVDAPVGAALRHLGSSSPGESVALATVAAHWSVSRPRLSQRVFQQTGVTFTGHLRLARMNIAARLLQDTSQTVGAIAAAAGYSHVPSLDKQFRQHFHITPSQFRRLVGPPTPATAELD
jgi:AraC-like DNA-binding protein